MDLGDSGGLLAGGRNPLAELARELLCSLLLPGFRGEVFEFVRISLVIVEFGACPAVLAPFRIAIAERLDAVAGEASLLTFDLAAEHTLGTGTFSESFRESVY